MRVALRSGFGVAAALMMACGSSPSASTPRQGDGGEADGSSTQGRDARATDARTNDVSSEASPPKDAALHESGPGDASSEAGDGAMGSRDGEVLDASAKDATSADVFTGDEAAAVDARIADATADARDAVSHATDAAGSDASRTNVTCGGITCYAGEACVGGVCETADCQGAHVPGDYPTVQAAMTAVGALAQGGTICLLPQAYTEAVEGHASGGLVTIQGAGTSATFLNIFIAESGPLALRGMELNSVQVGAVDLTLTNVVVTPLEGADYAVLLGGTANGNIFLSGVAINAGGADEGIAFSTGTTARLTVESSYIEGAGAGIALLAEGSVSTVSVINTTFVENGNAAIAFDMAQDNSGPPVAAVYNSLFLNNGAAINISNAGLAGHNAFYGNFVNYTGSAVAGMGDITSNPLVDGASPPDLLSGSPCIGAADPTHAASVDFYGRPLRAMPDIGAVQSEP